MNRVINIGFLFLYLIVIIRPIVPYIEYAINKDYIAKALCINKKDPKLSCNGKCYLNSQLKKANETKQSDKQSVPPKVESEKYPIAFMKEYNYSNEQIYLTLNTSFPNYIFKIEVNFPDVPTPPPKLFC